MLGLNLGRNLHYLEGEITKHLWSIWEFLKRPFVMKLSCGFAGTIFMFENCFKEKLFRVIGDIWSLGLETKCQSV